MLDSSTADIAPGPFIGAFGAYCKPKGCRGEGSAEVAADVV